MFRRALLQASRASRPGLQSSLAQAAARPSFPALRVPLATSRRSVTAPRWYSVATESSEGARDEASPAEVKSGEKDDVKATDPLRTELETKNKEIIDLKDKYLRSVAEYRNLQDRTKRDVQSAKDFAIQRFAKDLIDSVDNLDRALTTVPEDVLKRPSAEQTDKDLLNLYEGLKMTENILMQTLTKHGLQRFDPSEGGERFNPNLHEATFQTPVEGKEDGQVVHTQQKGFLLNGRVLRAAKVGVVKNS
ncbi:MAG: Mitochondrial matrix cochaperone [Thelocarpon impressellum]|nr:MAG: Mitochondrial matrix cochaperone [Thelocarpon impressellum]